ncbi:hypothetical protein F5148DRAFT_274400 [Russula earlei]|uniref:Uncharacterized protein n=1 Tax=Russula earlei TaxID=71964 RepID=A0ACC0U4B2_9AGAM|nr:hypothetical protein F5148DRAFT_274400 [Russula earlei]
MPANSHSREALSPMLNADGPAPEDGHSTTFDDPRPPLGVKLTGYRLLNMSVVFLFGLTKAILTYMGQSAAPTTLDWILGSFLAVFLYWIGLYESECTERWDWFFRVDLAHAIGYCLKRFGGGLVGVLFALQGTLTITSLSCLPVFILAYFIPRVPLDIWLVIYVCFMACVHYAWRRVSKGHFLG